MVTTALRALIPLTFCVLASDVSAEILPNQMPKRDPKLSYEAALPSANLWGFKGEVRKPDKRKSDSRVSGSLGPPPGYPDWASVMPNGSVEACPWRYQEPGVCYIPLHRVVRNNEAANNMSNQRWCTPTQDISLGVDGRPNITTFSPICIRFSESRDEQGRIVISSSYDRFQLKDLSEGFKPVPPGNHFARPDVTGDVYFFDSKTKLLLAGADVGQITRVCYNTPKLITGDDASYRTNQTLSVLESAGSAILHLYVVAGAPCS